MNVLSINSFPMGSSSPIGYMGEHLFNDPRFSVFELATRRTPRYSTFAQLFYINPNRILIDFHEPDESSCMADVSQRMGRDKPRGSLLKTAWKVMAPVKVSSEAMELLESFSPDVVYTQGYDVRILKLARSFSSHFNIPCVVHTLDNWFSENSLILRLQMREMGKCIAKGGKHLAGSPAMARWLASQYTGDFIFISNCSTPCEVAEPIATEESGKVYLYSGNLTPRRFESLNILADQLRVGNKLVVYAPFSQMKLIDQLDERIEVHQAVSQIEMPQVINSADVLVHVESFDECARKFAKYSLSTKIGEYLMYEKPILYYGPFDVGVADFLNSLDIGLRAESLDDLRDAIRQIEGGQSLVGLIQRQIEVGEKLFRTENVRKRLYESINEA